MASNLYTNYKVQAMKGSINLTSANIYCALMTSSYTPNQDTDTYFADINTNESSGTGYTAGGQLVTSLTVTQDNTNHRSLFTAANVSWASSTIANARYAILYVNTGTTSTSTLIGVVDLLSTKTTNGDTFYIQWNATGIFTLT